MSGHPLEQPAPLPESTPVRPKRRRRGLLRPWQYAALVAAFFLGALAMSGLVGNEPLRRSMEARINRGLHGYTVRIGKLRLQPIGGALALEGVEVRQTAHPDPPLAVLPLLRASVEWRQLFFLRLVGDLLIEKPAVSMNLAQLEGEVTNAVPVRQRGWQQALEAIYPLRINHLRIDDASVVYVDAAPDRPLRVTHLNVRASNIRNIHSRDRTYPSPIEAEAFVFGSGRASLAGNADFLAEPHLGLLGDFRVKDIPLDDLRPLGSHWNVETRHGTLSASGQVEYAPTVRRLHVPSVLLRGVQADYVRRPPERAKDSLRVAVEQSTRKAAEAPPWDLALDRIQLRGADLGFRNEGARPAYRVFVNGAELDVNGFSTRSSSRPAVAVLSGRFMGNGAARARVRFWPVDGGSDADVNVAVEATDMRTMNDLFRAHGKFDVAAGTFSLYSQIGLRGHEVEGYVKPIFQSVEIYDSRQDAGKGVFRKIYESAVDAAAKLLTNPKHKQVATAFELHGPVSGPRSSTLEIVGGLIENAFFKAILPGFDQQIGTRGQPRP
jgi:hypothetical protein